MIEATLKVNSLGYNEMYTGGKAQFSQIYALICMKKNTDPLNPDKGVDINSYYYAFNDPVVLADLERKISDQIETYTPYQPLSVQCGSKWVRDKYIISIIISLSGYSESVVIVSNGEQSDYDIFKST